MSAELYMFSKRDTAYLLSLYEELIRAIQAEGIDTTQSTYNIEDAQLERIADKLTKRPETALQKIDRAMSRPYFSIMRADLRSMLREDYTKQYPQATAEDLKGRGFHLNGKDYMTYREWFYLRSDSRPGDLLNRAFMTAVNNPGKKITPSMIDTRANYYPQPYLWPIFPETPTYKKLEDAPTNYDEDPETLRQIRQELGLEEYSFIGLYLQGHIPFLRDILKAIIEQRPVEIRGDLLPSMGTPERAVMPNNAVINQMQAEEIINAGDYNIPVAWTKGRNKQQIFAYVIIEEITGQDAQGRPVALTGYERTVTDAICSLWVTAKELNFPAIFTVDAIARAMPGGSNKATPKQKQEIIATMERLRRYHIYINATDEMRSRGLIGDTEEFILDNFYITATRASIITKNGHKKAVAYRFTEPPLLFTYSEKTNQILSVKAELLSIERTTKNPVTEKLEASKIPLKMNATRQAITSYLARRIEIMKRDNEKAKEKLRAYEQKRKADKSGTLPEKPLEAFREQSHTILFSSVFFNAGLAAKDGSGIDKDAAKEYRNFCFQVLDYQTAKGNIKGYAKQTKKRQIEGVKLTL